jgi:hypothetical protein
VLSRPGTTRLHVSNSNVFSDITGPELELNVDFSFKRIEQNEVPLSLLELGPIKN